MGLFTTRETRSIFLAVFAFLLVGGVVVLILQVWYVWVPIVAVLLVLAAVWIARNPTKTGTFVANYRAARARRR